MCGACPKIVLNLIFSKQLPVGAYTKELMSNFNTSAEIVLKNQIVQENIYGDQENLFHV